MSQSQKQLAALWLYQGYSYEQVAASMGVSVYTLYLMVTV